MKAILVRYFPPAIDEHCMFGRAEIAVGEATLIVENFFAAEREAVGATLDLEIRPDFADLQESWEQIFSRNEQQQIALIPLGGVSYLALGRIIGVDSLVADCGLLSLRVPLSSKDIRVIGEPVGFTVSALAAYGAKLTSPLIDEGVW